MRTILNLPEQRERAAKAGGKPPPRRRRFPIFGSNTPGSLRLTNAKIAKLEAEEGVRRHGRGR